MKINFLDDYLEESLVIMIKSLKWIDKYDDRKHSYRRGDYLWSMGLLDISFM